MRIANTIGWNIPWLRKMIRWICRELEYDWRKITAANFSLAHRSSYRGKAFCHRHAIRVKINPLNAYPVSARKHRGLPDLEMHDAAELVVRLTAHEIAHLVRWDRFAREWQREGKRDSCMERDTEALARMVLRAFRERRAELLSQWGEAGPGPVPPKTIHQLTCRRCGNVWRSAKALSDCRRRSCGKCFRRWKDAARAREFLIYERVTNGAGEGHL